MSEDYERDNYLFPGLRVSRTGKRIGEGHGLAVRDWFAGQWVAGRWLAIGSRSNLTADDAADMAYEFADAMMRRRSK